MNIIKKLNHGDPQLYDKLIHELFEEMKINRVKTIAIIDEDLSKKVNIFYLFELFHFHFCS